MTSKILKRIAIGVIWISLSVGNAGFLVAYYQSIGAHLRGFPEDHFRSDLGVSVGISLIPLVWVVTPFLTGFYEHGWQITPTHTVEAKP